MMHNFKFSDCLDRIYPSEFKLMDTTASYIDLHLQIDSPIL